MHVRWLLRSLAMVCLLAVAAWVLAGLPNLTERFWDQQNSRQSEKNDDSIFLTQSNLVDHFTQLGFHIPLQRVEWSGELLMVDFQMISISQREHLYSDLYRLSEFAFSQTNNVNQLLIKVNAYQEGENRLLISLDAGRNQWKQHRPMEEWLNLVLTYRG